MPCTLEARTVIKTSCLRSSILTLFENRWKAKSQVSSKVETKQTQTQTQPKTTQQRKTPRKLSETLRFQKRKSSYRSVLLHDDIAIPANKCPKWLQVGEGGCPASSQLLNKGGKLVHPRPRRWSCARQEFHCSSCSCYNTTAKSRWKVIVCCCFRARVHKEDPGRNPFNSTVAR